MLHNFDILASQTDLGTAYDLNSIMHYPDTAFAKKRGEKTIVSKTGKIIKPSKKLTETDIDEIRTLYSCRKGYHMFIIIIIIVLLKKLFYRLSY